MLCIKDRFHKLQYWSREEPIGPSTMPISTSFIANLLCTWKKISFEIFCFFTLAIYRENFSMLSSSLSKSKLKKKKLCFINTKSNWINSNLNLQQELVEKASWIWKWRYENVWLLLFFALFFNWIVICSKF